jgi:hypothetical protein
MKNIGIRALVLGLLALAVVGPMACGDSSNSVLGGNGATPTHGHNGKGHGLGLVRNSHAPNAPVTVGTPPSSVDLTQYDPPVGDQDGVESCVAWSTGYYLRGWYANRDGYFPPGGSPPSGSFEPMYTYAQIVRGNNVGTTFADNLNIQQGQGIDSRADYSQGDYDYTTQPTTAETANAGQDTIVSYNDVGNPGGTGFQNWIENTLASGNPVAIAIPVYPEFDGVSATNNWLVGTPTAGETSRGGHAVFAPKYDANGLWIENSWGTGWGNNGYAELSWAFVNQDAWEGVTIVPRTDFAGTWNGMESANIIHQTPTLIRIGITQSGAQANVSIYQQLGGVIPSSPQSMGTATITNGTVTLDLTETINGQPFTSNHWVLSFPTPGTLHFTHHTHYLQPGDTRPDTDTTGDLTRS